MKKLLLSQPVDSEVFEMLVMAENVLVQVDDNFIHISNFLTFWGFNDFLLMIHKLVRMSNDV